MSTPCRVALGRDASGRIAESAREECVLEVCAIEVDVAAIRVEVGARVGLLERGPQIVLTRRETRAVPVKDGDDLAGVVVDECVVAAEVGVADDVRSRRRAGALDRTLEPVELRLDLGSPVADPRVVKQAAHRLDAPRLIDRQAREADERVVVHEPHGACQRGCVGASGLAAAHEREHRDSPPRDNRRHLRHDDGQIEVAERLFAVTT